MFQFSEFFTWTPLYWGCSLAFPLFFSQYETLENHFTGLSLGLTSVVIGQIVTVVYYTLYNRVQWSEQYQSAIIQHILQPEGTLLLGSYLSIYWFSGFMPISYYSPVGGIHWSHVALQLLIQDFLQFIMHRIEHIYSPLYRQLHQSHHRHIHPTLLDAFDGSIGDTFFMILVPLWITSRIVHTNVWSYMVFGTIYANALTLIHSEVEHPWECLLYYLGIGTAQDHHIHHTKMKRNYGHIFMYWDNLSGTYTAMNRYEGAVVMNEQPLIVSKHHANVFWYLSWISFISSAYAYYRNHLDLYIGPAIVGLTSLNYWRHPVKSWRRNMDIGVVHSVLFYQILRSMDVTGRHFYWCILGISCACYPLSLISEKYNAETLSIVFHAMVHVVGNISNMILYSGEIPELRESWIMVRVG